MNFKRSTVAVLASTAMVLALATSAFAQAEPSPSPSPSTDPSPSPSPSASPTSSPSPSPSPSVSPSPSASTDPAAGGTSKQEVLGETTTLGETNNNREIAKWVIALSVGILAFLIGLKIARSKAEE